MSVQCAVSGRQEGLPGNTLRILNPALFALGVATGRGALLQHPSFGTSQAAVDLLQFTAILNLNAKVLYARGRSTPADREVEPRIIQHPSGIVGFDQARRAAKELGVERHTLIQIANRHVNMKTLHETLLLRGRTAAGAQLRPPQQFLVRNPSSAFIRS